MKKQEAIRMFGDRHSDLAHALGISRSAVSQWPDELDQERTDRVVGAAVRLGLWRKYLAQRRKQDAA